MTISLATKGMVTQSTCVLDFTNTISANILSSANVPLTQCGLPLELRRGNSVTLDFIVSIDGIRLLESQLLAADDIVFVFKIEKSDDEIDAVLLKKKSLAEIEVLPDSSIPNLRIALSSSDTTLDVNAYFAGLQIRFVPNDCKEAALQFNACGFDTVLILGDVVRCL